MSYFFTNNFKTALAANQAIMDGGQTFKLALFRFAPGLETINPAWRAAKTVAELVATPGWVEVTGITGYPLTNTMPTSTRILGGSRYVMYNPYKFDALSVPTEVRAIGVVATGPAIGGVSNALIMVTTTPIGGVLNLAPADSLTSAPDSSKNAAGVPTFPDATNRWMFSWSVSSPDPVEGVLVIAKGSPPFEVSGSQHTWLYPQRANMISNPSFEATGVNYWSTNGTLTRVSGAAPGSIGGWSGQVTDLTPPYVRLNGTAGTYIEGPDIAAFGGATELTLEIDCSLDDWSPASPQALAGQMASNQQSWYFSISASGVPQMAVSLTGNGTSVYSPGGDFGFADGSRHVVKGTWKATDPTNMSLVFTKDGVVHGVKYDSGSPGSPLFNSTARVTIGSAQFLSIMVGCVYGVKLWANGVLVASPDFTNMVVGQTSVIDAQGNTWTLKGAAALAGDFTPLAVESNIWSTQMGEKFNEDWTVQLMAKGSGKLKVGLVYWDSHGRSTLGDWGQNETWDLVSDSWTHVAVHRHIPSAHLAMLRLELQGSSLTIDQVLAEPGFLKDWLYFDGDERYGARDDFCWYGGYNRQGKSYSLWYNHRKAVVGRLFARSIDPNDPTKNVTDEDMEEQGLVYRWVPAGITVVPHMDVFYPYDPQNPVPTKAAGVLPYYHATTAPDGVTNPWV